LSLGVELGSENRSSDSSVEGIGEGSLDGLVNGDWDGIDGGVSPGIDDGLKEGFKNGFSDGRSDGIKEGRRNGIKDMASRMACFLFEVELGSDDVSLSGSVKRIHEGWSSGLVNAFSSSCLLE
jgi:hypothetical protein